jgi:hypothetical protein
MKEHNYKLVDELLNSRRLEQQENLLWGNDFQLEQEELPIGSAIVDEEILEVIITDQEGNQFNFVGEFSMKREGEKVIFISNR